MTDRLDKDKPSRTSSLSRGKKKGGVSSGRAGGPGPNTTPISSFFSRQPPPKLACPLCGLLVPRFKINEHIDVECQNFERSDSSAQLASNGVELSPTRSPLKSPTSNEEKEETKTSPYFKKSSSTQAPREVGKKNVIRAIDLGSLSAKLSRKSGTASSERTQTGGKHAQTAKDNNSEMISSSQKENQLTEGLEDKKDCSWVADLTMNSTNLPNAAVDVSGLEVKHRLDQKAKLDQMEIAPEVNSSSLKLSKRKKEDPTSGGGRRLSFRKRAKHEKREEGRRDGVMEEMSPRERVGSGDADQRPEVPSHPATTSSGENAGDSESASLAEVGAGDQVADGAQLPRLPYYLRNFRTVLQAVLENGDDRQLFDELDMSHVHAFERLSGR